MDKKEELFAIMQKQGFSELASTFRSPYSGIKVEEIYFNWLRYSETGKLPYIPLKGGA